ncbi:MAG: phosphate signaling complex protein PhoU [Anaeroplasma sp.]|nr:phosphate signaling complex protein PhoU [Anaeroplasma sp.]
MKLEEEIDHLCQMMVKMSEQVIENLKNALDIYYNFDEKKLDLINDDIVDLHERLIEETCLNIMLRERPYAKDLRMVSGILKCVEDVERLGDHAEDIRDFAVKLKNEAHHEIAELDQAIDVTIKMVNDSVQSFVNKDIKLANDVIKRDDIVDELYEQCLSTIIENDKKEYSSEFSVYTTLIVKYIERIADHAVNISEWVVYILSGYYKDKQIF